MNHFKSETTVSTESNSRQNNFNIVRFIASVMVIYGHMMHIMGTPIFTVYNQAVSTIAVKIFFVISGYLITKSLLSDSHFVRYLLRRCFRIFPGLIAVVLFAILIVGPMTTSLPLSEYFQSPVTWLYLKNIILFPMYSLPGCFGDYTYPNAINGSLWTLPVEFAMYLLLPLLVFIFQKIKALKPGIIITCVLFAVLDIAQPFLFNGTSLVIYGTNVPDALPLIPFFFLGSLFSLPDMKKYLNLQLGTALIVVGSLINFSATFSELYLILILPYYILSFSLTPQPIFSKCFARCDFSYGMYLYGFTIQQVVWNYLKHIQSSFFNLNTVSVICVAVTLLFAVASWYLVEKPLQQLGKKIIQSIPGRKIKVN